MAKIVVEGLKYRYPLSQKLALNDISFEINEGEFIGIIGANGAGKSTLCQALTGIVPLFFKGAYGGRVIIDDVEVAKSNLSEISLKIGMVFQNPFTQITGSKLTVYEEVAFGLENMGLEREEMKRRIDDALMLLDLYRHKDKNPFDLSGGQMQRLAIASIIAMQPKIIVLDEPTSQLDPQGSNEVFKAVSDLKKKGITIIMVEHKVEKLSEYADRIMLLHDGRLIDFDTPSKIFSRDDLKDYGVVDPVFTRYCKKIGLKDERGLYPVTLDEAVNLVVKKREHSS